MSLENSRGDKDDDFDVFTDKVTDAMEILFDDDSIYDERPVEDIVVIFEPEERSQRREFGGPIENLSISIRIGPSLIPHAGAGVIANETIPKGYCAKYLGRWVPISDDPSCDVSGYRWTVFEWDSITGKPKQPNITAGFVDGIKESESSWPRFVNCSSSEDSANMKQWQEFNQVYYGTKRDIEPGEELLVWYGPAFARILGIPC